MSSETEHARRDQDLAVLASARARGGLATWGAYLRLSGPGWLQSAITLGGGSLAGSLYLGVLSGMSLLWLQPLAMVMGIIMLSAIAYVALSTQERPFLAVNRHVSPVLGWGWALATLAANMVWALPQYSLGTSVVQQNLLPGLLGEKGPLGDTGGKVVIVAVILAISIAVTWSWNRGARGVRLYERLLKILVGVVVVSFFGVVVKLGLSDSGLDFSAMLAGFIPDISQWSHPAATFEPHLSVLSASAREFWSASIVSMQRDVIIGAAATAVGINMTFLLPYSLLGRGWNREFRGLARFDLATGMLIPFLLATTCVVVAAANRFHTEPVPGLVTEAEVAPHPRLQKNFDELLASRVKAKGDGAQVADIPVEERRIAAMLVKRDAFDLARALAPLTGDVFANLLFGIGVLGMALSTISLLMLISGFVICEMLGAPQGGWTHRLGTLAACSGALGPFVWSKAAFYLAVPTSMFGMALLPIAYWTFFLMMNSPSLLGDAMPKGRARWIWNGLMLPAAGLATLASLWSIWAKTGIGGMAALGGFLALAVIVHVRRRGH